MTALRKVCETAIQRDWVELVVYYITLDRPDAPIKIGLTMGSLRRRLSELQTSSPDEMIVLAWEPWVAGKERNLHKKFAADRIRGEWFRRSPALMERIDGILQSAQWKDFHSPRGPRARP